MEIRRRYRHTDLFLVRVWTGEAGDGTGNVKWAGKSHGFSGWQGLVDALLNMLTETGDNRPSGGEASLG
jgi:hypothetical protein